MKRCPVCDKTWEINKVFCPWDGYKLKDMTPEETAERVASKPTEPQFEMFEELQKSQKTLLDSLAEFGSTETSHLVDVALEALKKRRENDQSLIKEQMKLMEDFNLHCRTMQYFVDKLKAQSDLFSFHIEHKDEVDRIYMRFIVSFGEVQYRRNFPVTIAYMREPTKEVLFEINLYEIGHDKDSRHFRAEKAGGKVETTVLGRRYYLAAPRGLEGIDLLKWLESSFKEIFRFAYSVD